MKNIFFQKKLSEELIAKEETEGYSRNTRPPISPQGNLKLQNSIETSHAPCAECHRADLFSNWGYLAFPMNWPYNFCVL